MKSVTNKPKTREPRAILNPQASKKKFQLSRYYPSPDLAFFVEHYWLVDWDPQGQRPYLAEVLPHPSIHMVFEKDKSRIVGVTTGKFTYRLQNKGRVFGVKFRSGAFHPFIKSPASELTDRSLDPQDVFRADCRALEEMLLLPGASIDPVEDLLRQHLPVQDERVVMINQIIEQMIPTQAITQVETLAEQLHMSKRTLQRLFHRYVGVGPKWVIRRHRLHEAVAQVASGNIADWPQLALALGYFDQAHFIKDFKTLVGKTPAAYAKSAGLRAPEIG